MHDSLPNIKSLDLPKLKLFSADKLNMDEYTWLVPDRVKNIQGKG